MIPVLLGVVKAVPIWVWGLSAALAWGGIQHYRAGHQAAKRATAEKAAAVQAVAAEEQAKAREREAALSDATRKAADAYRSDLAKRNAAAAAVRADRDRLLDAVATGAGTCQAGPSSAAASGVDGSASLRVVVRECSAALQTVAEAADTADARLKGLQDYVRSIQQD